LAFTFIRQERRSKKKKQTGRQQNLTFS